MTLHAYFTQLEQTIATTNDLVMIGKVVRVSGFLLEAIGLKASVSSVCRVFSARNKTSLLAEVIGFANDSTYLMAVADPTEILPNDSITFVSKQFRVPVGKALMGRIVGGFCQPIDKKEPFTCQNYYPIISQAINPIDRNRITEPLDVGVRAINGLLTVGVGQRLGIFAGSGVGKSVLLGMMTRFTKAQVVVVGLIGERGREVKEFIEENIGADHLHKTIVVAAPIDASPLERTNGALTAITIAEFFRDQGLDVLLIIDSLTRYAQALRQMYLLLGEAPSSKGYSPSVFAKISQLIERCGNGDQNQGSITAFFTVLTEGDDTNDPVADHARSVLDGHIILSRELAEAAHFPAIDINASISRVMPNVVSKENNDTAMHFKRLYAHYVQNHDLIKMGMYKQGHDALLDEAITQHTALNNFLQQDVDESASIADSIAALKIIFSAHPSD